MTRETCDKLSAHIDRITADINGRIGVVTEQPFDDVVNGAKGEKLRHQFSEQDFAILRHSLAALKVIISVRM